MKEEIKSVFRSRAMWFAFAFMFVTLLGYSACCWIGYIDLGEPVEYRESALQLAIGGVFFGGFMLMLPFTTALCHAVTQVDELRSGMLRWRAMRSSPGKVMRAKATAAALAAAFSCTAAFVLHALIWYFIAEPVDIEAYPNHVIYFSQKCVFSAWYTVADGLPVYVEMALGIAVTAAVWAVVGLAVAVWIPDKLMVMTVPVCLYFLWREQFQYYFTGVLVPEPATLFNDGLSLQSGAQALAMYAALLAAALALYYVGLKRRCQNA